MLLHLLALHFDSFRLDIIKEYHTWGLTNLTTLAHFVTDGSTALSIMFSSYTSKKPVDAALTSLHYAFPIVIFGYFLVASCTAFCLLSEKKTHPRRSTLLGLMLFTTLSYLAQIVAIIVPSIYMKEWLGNQDVMIGHLSSILVFGLQLAMLSDETDFVWFPYIGSYVLSLGFELVLLVGSLSVRTSGHISGTKIAQLTIAAARYVAMVFVVAVFSWTNSDVVPDPGIDAERQPLLSTDSTPAGALEEGEGSQAPTAYGSTTTTTKSSTSSSTSEDSNSEHSSTITKDDGNGKKDSNSKDNDNNASELPWERRERERREEMEKCLKETGNWLGYTRRFFVSCSLLEFFFTFTYIQVFPNLKFRFFSRTSGLPITASYKFELFLSACAFWPIMPSMSSSRANWALLWTA